MWLLAQLYRHTTLYNILCGKDGCEHLNILPVFQIWFQPAAMVAVISRQSIKLNIGKISKKVSDLELQRKKIYENIVQLKQARDRLIIKLRNIPAAEKARERHIEVEDIKAGTDPFPTDDVIKCRSNDMVETSSDLFPTNDDCLLAVTTVYNDPALSLPNFQ